MNKKSVKLITDIGGYDVYEYDTNKVITTHRWNHNYSMLDIINRTVLFTIPSDGNYTYHLLAFLWYSYLDKPYLLAMQKRRVCLINTKKRTKEQIHEIKTSNSSPMTFTQDGRHILVEEGNKLTMF